MSTTKNSLSKVGGVEIVTGINTVGLCYIYYELHKLGVDLNTRLRDISTVVKTINSNVNVIYQHFRAHLIRHKNVLDVETSENEFLINKIKELEEKIEIEKYNNQVLYNTLQELTLRMEKVESKN